MKDRPNEMTMKRKNMIFLLLAGAAALAGCAKEGLLGAGRGSAVVFRAGSSYSNGTVTKTAYSGEGLFTGETLTRERIDWVDGDVIRIYSAEASLADGSAHYADYDVSLSSNAGDKSYATVAPHNANGLVWGDGTHEFYCVYPSPVSGAGTTRLERNTITATIPAVQAYTLDGTALKPDMDYAYMYAAVRTEASSSVTLSFLPMFTAFEFTVDSADDAAMTLTGFEMVSASYDLSGKISATLSASTASESSTAAYNFSDTGRSIRVGFGGGVVVEKGHPVTFTVFALPQDLSDLTIRFSTAAGETKSLDLKEQGAAGFYRFSGCKKYRITSLAVPGRWTYSIETIPAITLTTNMEKLYGADREITVESRRTRSSSPIEPVSWTAQASTDNYTWYSHEDAGWPSWLSLSAYEGTGEADAVVVTVALNETYKEIPTGLGAPMMEDLSAMPETGSEAQPYDLSMHDIFGGANTNGATTANSYVVCAPGWYMLPLVYGNAITRGSVNQKAFRPGISSGLSMSSFVGSDGNDITSPYILEDGGLSLSGEYDGCIVWEDVMPGYDIVDPGSVRIVDAPSGAGLSCKYLRFRIDPEDIKPGNLVLALRDTGRDNQILWSWHIWVVMRSGLTTSDVVYRTASGGTASLTMLDINLGWTPPMNYAPLRTRARSAYIRIKQDVEAGTSTTFRVQQQAYTGTTYAGTGYSNPFYQWGRKDPFLPAQGLQNQNKSNASPAAYTITSGNSSVIFTSSNISATAWYTRGIREPYRLLRNDDLSGVNNAWDADNTAFSTDSRVVKTINDPCPPGFCVPRFFAFTGFTSTGENSTHDPDIYGDWVAQDDAAGRPAGWNFTTTGTDADKTLFFPLGGFRPYNGNIASVSERGYYWTAAPYERNGSPYGYAESGFLQQNRVDPQYNMPSSHATSIRPVREE